MKRMVEMIKNQQSRNLKHDTDSFHTIIFD